MIVFVPSDSIPTIVETDAHPLRLQMQGLPDTH
jgi:hypothetical protein